MIRKGLFLILIVLLAATAALSGQSFGWTLVKAQIRREFPEVMRISTAELAKRLTSSEGPKPILLDVRTRPEFEVSHLPGAQRIAPDSDAKTISLPKDQPIVTYCSVGYRSAKFARQLRQAGYGKVANLEGSIFQWANENRPLAHDGQPTKAVHPYNRIWGLLLNKSHRATIR